MMTIFLLFKMKKYKIKIETKTGNIPVEVVLDPKKQTYLRGLKRSKKVKEGKDFFTLSKYMVLWKKK